jgi:hypothetical protein
MGLTTSLPGDEFGGFFSSNASLRGTANAFEGVYIDDIIIGFAERGEMVTGAPNNTTFIQNPEVNDPNNPNPYNDILEGAYDVEVRRASDFATSVGIPNGQFTAFDSNDRLMQQQTLIVANSWDLYDGMTFTLSDGVDSVVFEYEDVNVGDGVAPGHQPIFFDPIAVQPTGGTAGEPGVDRRRTDPGRDQFTCRAGYSGRTGLLVGWSRQSRRPEHQQPSQHLRDCPLHPDGRTAGSAEWTESARGVRIDSTARQLQWLGQSVQLYQ